MIGRWKARGMQPFANHFAAKYGWSPAEEARTERLLGALIADLARAVASPPYLVGDGFTRADLTVACMVAGVIGIPPDELFALEESMRAMFGVLPEEDPAVAPLRAWRDGIYRRHRGVRVTPAAVARTSRGSGGEVGARRSAAIGAALVAIVLEVLCAAHTNASPGSRCRHYCASVIDECQQQGEPRRRCRRRYVRLCKSSGFTACDL